MKNIKKIVLTGGPCAGKTSVMPTITEHFTLQGWKVIAIPETATMLILSGAAPSSFSSVFEFETHLVNLQLSIEQFYFNLAANLPDDKILLVLDRGLLDIDAYLQPGELAAILATKSTDPLHAASRYDAVFHLTTAAKGTDSYNRLTNTARLETFEEAIAADDRTLNAWIGHPHLRVIHAHPDFNVKKRQLLSAIAHVLGEPEPLEIERKFLVTKPSLQALSKLHCRRLDITQTYLNPNGSHEERVRQITIDGQRIYTHTIKHPLEMRHCYWTPELANQFHTTRGEREQIISKEDYLNLLASASPNHRTIHKTRYRFMTDDYQYIELDISDDWPYALAEVELISPDEPVTFPSWLTVLREVTGDHSFRNASIAAHGFPKI